MPAENEPPLFTDIASTSTKSDSSLRVRSIQFDARADPSPTSA